MYSIEMIMMIEMINTLLLVVDERGQPHAPRLALPQVTKVHRGFSSRNQSPIPNWSYIDIGCFGVFETRRLLKCWLFPLNKGSPTSTGLGTGPERGKKCIR